MLHGLLNAMIFDRCLSIGRSAFGAFGAACPSEACHPRVTSLGPSVHGKVDPRLKPRRLRRGRVKGCCVECY